jgi:phenylacetate-CoA ligase
VTSTSDETTDDQRFWNSAAQTMPRDELRALQGARLRESVARAYEGAPFFRTRFDDVGLRPDDVTGLDSLSSIPTFRKQALRDDEARYPPIGRYRASGLRGAVRLAMSTGTTGRPTFTLWTRHDLELECELGARMQWRLGIRPGMIVANAHPGYLNGGQAFISALYESMGCLSISLGPPESVEAAEAALRAIEHIPVDHWGLFPAALARFREAAARMGYKGKLPEPEEIGPTYQHDRISAGQDCVGFLGSACSPGKGSHLAEDYAIVEALDPATGVPVPDGTRGYFVVTSLGRDNPMIRYDMEDVIRIEPALCDCGETSRRAFWEGRGKDIVEVAGRWILPIDVWKEVPADTEFVLVRRPRPAERLEVRIEGALTPDLADRLEASLDVPVDLVRVDDGTLPRSAYKAQRVIDEG